MFRKIFARLILAIKAIRYGTIPSAPMSAVRPITPQEVEEAQTFFPIPKFFIFGHARSGTTLLARLIRLHPEVHCNWQAHFFTRPPFLESLVISPQVTEWLSRRSNRWNRGQDLSPVVLRAVSDYILERDARLEGKSIVGDKSPNSLMNGEAVRMMRKIYPDARLIFIVRDGRDAAVSHRIQTFIDAPQHLSKRDRVIREALSKDPESFLNAQRSIFTRRLIHTYAEGWLKNVTETDALGQQIYPDRYLSLRYEDLLAEPWEQMCRLWKWLGVDIGVANLKTELEVEISFNPDKDWQRERAQDIVGSLKKGVSGSWQDIFTSRDRAIYKRVAGQSLMAWGYENDLEW
jgi:hypothetical protein